LRSIRLVWVTVVALQIMLNDKYKLNHCKEMGPVPGSRFLIQPVAKLEPEWLQGEVSRTFASRPYGLNARFVKKVRMAKVWYRNNIFHCNGQQSNIRKVRNLFNRKNYIEMQNTPPKQETNIISMVQNRENQPFHPNFKQFSAQPTNTYFTSPSLIFHTDSISVKISSNTFRDLEILHNMWSMLITRRQLWGRQISADNLTLILNFSNFTHNPRTHILYQCLWYFMQIPYLLKFRATLFGISRFCTKCKACSLRADSLWGRQISADNLTLIINFNNFTHNPRTHILYHRLWYFIQIAFETDVGKNILFAVDAENFSAQSTHSESWKFSRKLYRGTERSHMLFCWLVSRRL